MDDEMFLGQLRSALPADLTVARARFDGVQRVFVLYSEGPSLQDLMGLLPADLPWEDPQVSIPDQGALLVTMEDVRFSIRRIYQRSLVAALSLDLAHLEDTELISALHVDLDAQTTPSEVAWVAATLMCDQLGLDPYEVTQTRMAFPSALWRPLYAEFWPAAEALV